MEVKYKTKYPHIFNVYWGNFPATDDAGDKIIIQNRNNLVEQYNITKYSDSKTAANILYLGSHAFDHPEMYDTNDKQTILLFSIYSTEENRKENKVLYELAQKIGFKKVQPLYVLSASTYMAIFEKKLLRSVYNNFKKMLKYHGID